jgi:CheY-like chemotaxis protein
LAKTKIYYIVDDDVDDQLFLIEALTKNDSSVQCLTALNGQELISHLQACGTVLPDMIFLDLNMPKMGGMQCLSELKLIPAFRHIPVIVCSTSCNVNEVAEVLKMGASHFFTKKSSFTELCIALSSLTAAY